MLAAPTSYVSLSPLGIGRGNGREMGLDWAWKSKIGLEMGLEMGVGLQAMVVQMLEADVEPWLVASGVVAWNVAWDVLRSPEGVL